MITDAVKQEPKASGTVSSRFFWLLVPLVALIFSLKTNWQAPPRFDGAGYAVLAESLRTGQGYRAIEHPDSPRHAHFPPGYPLALAALWSITGPSYVVAHGLSVGCTLGAVLLFRHWLTRLMPTRSAGLLALAIAFNWTWLRTSGTIQSEPLFLLLSGALLVAAHACQQSSSSGTWLALGLLAAACVLTRQVGMMLALAVGIDLLMSRRILPLRVYLGSLGLGILPWILWQLSVQEGTQAGLLPRQGILNLIAEQASFYLLRIPDQLFGPFNEIATIFKPRWRALGYVWGLLSTGVILAGLAVSLRHANRRIAGLAFFLTLALLLVWPFQEAGRFLIPLIPFLLLGAWQAIQSLTGAETGRSGRIPLISAERAAWMLLLASLPYSLYSLIPKKVGPETPFDSACQWIATQGQKPGPVLTRQGGEAYWLMNQARKVVPAPSPESGQTVELTLVKYQVAYLIDDAGRYVRSAPGTVAQFVIDFPNRVEAVWSQGPVTVYQVRETPAVPETPG